MPARVQAARARPRLRRRVARQASGPMPIRRHPPSELVPWQAAFSRRAARSAIRAASTPTSPQPAASAPHAMNKIDGGASARPRLISRPRCGARENLRAPRRTRWCGGCFRGTQGASASRSRARAGVETIESAATWCCAPARSTRRASCCARGSARAPRSSASAASSWPTCPRSARAARSPGHGDLPAPALRRVQRRRTR